MVRGVVLYAKELAKLRDFYLALSGEITDEVDGDFVVITSKDADLIVLQAPEYVAS